MSAPLLAQAIQYHKNGALALAEEIYAQILAVSPGDPDTLHYYGMLKHQQGKNTQAISLLSQVLSADNTRAMTHFNLAVILQAEKQYAPAESHYTACVKYAPSYVMAFNNLAIVQKLQGNSEQAELNCQKALTLDSNCVEALVNLGTLYREKNPAKALELNARAVALNPALSACHVNLGVLYFDQREYEKGLHHYQAALALEPGKAAIRSAYLSRLRYVTHLTDEQIALAHKAWSQMHESGLSHWYKENNYTDRQHRKLRIGYISPDFRRHPVSFFFAPILAAHDKTHFEIYCYSNSTTRDEITKQLEQNADCWRTIFGMNDNRVADLIVSDRIDILVDLAGHTKDDRLLVFARKPAPVQISYLGYADTTGLSAMDYRITDHYADPVGETEQFHSERLLRMKNSFLVFDTLRDAPPVNVAPCVKNGFITFGCFNNFLKISDEVIALWARILHQVPGSVLKLKTSFNPLVNFQDSIYKEFEKYGIGNERVGYLAHTASYGDHLGCYHQIDIALDTYPCHGTTTTVEALWMGVPVISLVGSTHPSRVGASILTNTLLPDFLAYSKSDYVDKAVTFATERKRIIALREQLRQRLEDSPICNPAAFVQELELQYFAAWDERFKLINEANNAASTVKRSVFELETDTKRKNGPVGTVNVFSQYGYTICLPASLNTLTTYVFLEQERWFETELNFLTHYLTAGMTVLDIGANYGAYTLLCANRVSDTGSVHAFEPFPETRHFLEKSISINGFNNTRVSEKAVGDFIGSASLALHEHTEGNAISSTGASGAMMRVSTTTVDDYVTHNIRADVDFIKIDAEGQECQIIRGASALLSQQSPLILYEVKHGNTVNRSLISQLALHGYDSYRLLASLNVLIPVTNADILDDYQLNLFACKQDRSRLLMEQDLLLDSVPANGEACDFDEREYLLRYDTFFPGDTDRYIDAKQAGVHHYRSGLSAYLGFVDGSRPKIQRFKFLIRASHAVQIALEEKWSAERACSMVTILLALGERRRAMALVEKTIENMKGNQNVYSGERLLPPSTRFLHILGKHDRAHWITAMLLDCYVSQKTFSGYFFSPEIAELLDLLRKSGYADDRIRRMFALFSMRNHNDKAGFDLATVSMSELNPSLWSGQTQTV